MATTPDGTENSTGSTTPKLVLAIASLLEKSTQRNAKIAPSKKDAVTVFHGSKAPNMSITRYMERINKYARCSTSCFVLAYIYIDRFIEGNGLRLTPLNIHRLLVTSVMVAAKFMDDECYNNAYYAKVGGVSTAEMNKLEIEFLFKIDFRLNVSVEVYGKYVRQLEREGGGVGRLMTSRFSPLG